MLYPDLRRLSLVHTCPTGMLATNQAESSGSNDPPPPAAGPAQREALRTPDILRTILFDLVNGEVEDACKAAARWCFLNKTNMVACDAKVWEELTHIIFPNARAPNSGYIARGKEPTEPKDWFFHLCTQRKKMRKLWEQEVELARNGLSKQMDEDVSSLTTQTATKTYLDLVIDRAWHDYRLKQLKSILYPMSFEPRYNLPDSVRMAMTDEVSRTERFIASIDQEMELTLAGGAKMPFRYYSGILEQNYLRNLRAIDQQQDYVYDLEPNPEFGPPSLEDVLYKEVEKYRARTVAREIKEDKDRNPLLYRKGEYREWLAEQERMWPREVALSERIEQAKALISRAAQPKYSGKAGRLSGRVGVTIARILKERKAFHSIASSPEIMNPLVEELERYVRLLEDEVGQASDKSVTVEDLFGLEDEDGQD